MKSGFIKIDKEEGYTSADIDAIVKRRLNTSKVGHLGTLDPFATGLLLVQVGDATKLTTLIQEEKKEYVATLQLGKTTPSLDTETEIEKEEVIPSLTDSDIRLVLSSFIGKQKQTPPLFSARHYKGIKAYHLAREGSKITLPQMDIEIYELELLSYNKEQQQIVFRCVVSKGTYIRVLGKDIAMRLKTIGYLTALRRTKIGNIDLSFSKKVKEVDETDLLPLTSLTPEIPKYHCDDPLSFRVKNGQTLKLDRVEDYLFMMENDTLLAIYKKDGHVYRCYKGMKHE